MKTIGLIGGTSWTSTAEYYRYINEGVASKLGGLHSAEIVLVSIDFSPLAAAIGSGDWDSAKSIFINAARKLERAGAGCVLMCTNTMHRLFDEVGQAVSIPVLHIADAAAVELKARGYRKAALLGTEATMRGEFYKGRIEQKSGVEVILPPQNDIVYINTAIFDRMCRDNYTQEDRSRFGAIIDGLKARGAECVILGCTEIPVLIKKASLPLLNTTKLHSAAAVDWAFSP